MSNTLSDIRDNSPNLIPFPKYFPSSSTVAIEQGNCLQLFRAATLWYQGFSRVVDKVLGLIWRCSSELTVIQLGQCTRGHEHDCEPSSNEI
jgi:hypothetical protein